MIEPKMTLRDWFAGQALSGLMNTPGVLGIHRLTVVESCYSMADAMLEHAAIGDPRSIDILAPLPNRARYALRNANIKTIGDLMLKTEHELLREPNFGRKSLKVLSEAMERIGRKIGEIA